MSAVDTRMARPDAIAIARAFVDLIEDCTDQLIVAGSLRRRLAMIGDIEIVAVPKVERLTGGLFGDDMGPVDLLDGRMTALLDNGEVTKRLDARGSPRWGPTLKYLTYQGARIDLFTPCAERVGWILMLRTGPAQFSRQLVMPKVDHRGKRLLTKDRRPGLLPTHIRPHEGWLCYRTSGERIPTPTEQDVFELFDLPYREPWERV